MQPEFENYGSSGRAGIVNWVAPPPARLKRVRNSRNNQQSNSHNERSRYDINGSRQLTNNYNSRQATTLDGPHDHNSSDQNLNDSGICDDLSFGGFIQSSNNDNNNNLNNSDNLSRPIIDLSVCKTISAFVGVHLQDLAECQQRIDRARSRLINAKLLDQKQPQQPKSSVDIHIAPKDDIKIKVRNEQTKAIEAVKQLTNYLKELSYLKRHCDSSRDPIDEEVVTKLSELRTEIIQALNYFVLSNSDIEIPILDSEVCEYDLCIDARLSKQDTKATINNEFPNLATSRVGIESGPAARRNPTRDPSPSSPIDNSSDHRNDELLVEQAQMEPACINLEERRREVQKLEKDAIELRRLFSEFYNLVRDQGEKLYTIEENIVISREKVNTGQRNIKAAAKNTIIFPITGCMIGALIGGPLGMVLGGKIGGITVACTGSLIGLGYGLNELVTKIF